MYSMSLTESCVSITFFGFGAWSVLLGYGLGAGGGTPHFVLCSKDDAASGYFNTSRVQSAPLIPHKTVNKASDRFVQFTKQLEF